jgi:nucleotide-binding universal stress UspA family protein
MIKRILVPTDGSEAAMEGIQYAIMLARKLGASLLGVYVVDIKLLEGPFLRDLSASLGTAPFVNYQGNITMLLEERGRMALDTFEKECEAAGIPCEATLSTGVVWRQVLEQSELADAIVMGRGGEHSEWLEGLMGSTTESVIRRAEVPVFVSQAARPLENTILAAFDNSSHSRQALRAAVVLAESFKAALHVLIVGHGDDAAILDAAKGYIQSHEVEVSYIQKDGVAEEIIIETAQDCNADLIALGAYGHSRITELVLGSTTAYTINKAQCPVLLCR